MQTFMPTHRQKSLGFLLKVSPLLKAQIYHMNDLCKVSWATLATYNRESTIILYNNSSKITMDAGSLDPNPKIHLDLTN